MASLALTLPQAFARAVTAYRSGKFAEAEDICRQILAAKADVFDAAYLLAVAQASLGRTQDALASFECALVLQPDHAEALNNRGVALRKLGRHAEALASYEQALIVAPDHPDALSNHGNVLQDLGRYGEAVESYDRALAIRLEFPEALSNRGNALRELGLFDEALISCERAAALRPGFAEALYNAGNALRALKRPGEALAFYGRALALRPGHGPTLNNRGAVLQELKRYDEALESYQAALAARPDLADAHYNRGNVLRDLNRPADALESYDAAIALRPDDPAALSNRGVVLQALKRQDEALESFERALAVDPDHPYAFSGAADCAAKLCDWDRREAYGGQIAARVAGETSIVSPFVLLGYSDDAALQRRCAERLVEDRFPASSPPLCDRTPYGHARVRIAYLSADFHRHPTAYLTAGLFEQHDGARFDIIGVSFGPDDNSDIRGRLIAAFDDFHDVRGRSDGQVAALLRALEIDIAVDLMGYTQDSRTGILAARPAPIQVNYLGFPASMGADFIDYVIADAVVLPEDQQPFYAEKIVRLAGCYQVNDRMREIAEATPSRRKAGLPDQGFVFCCFNSLWKITPATFDVWMRLLAHTPGSVLWLLGDNETAERNLRREAQKRGIDPARLVFAAFLPLERHLARHRLADLFLDTLPYNAHTTASDALWAGLPVLTCRGKAFAGRVAASLLQAAGLPDLITTRLEDYEALALALARDPAGLAAVGSRLAANRGACPLFDTGLFARRIEAAYETMLEKASGMA